MAHKTRRQSPRRSNDGGEIIHSGRIETRATSARRATPIPLAPESLAQLALQLGEALRPVSVDRPMVGELIHDWLHTIATRRVRPKEEPWQASKLRLLYLEDESTLTSAAVTEVLERLVAGGYSPSTVNKIRAAGRLAIKYAQAAGRWRSPNPFALAPRIREPKRRYVTLTLPELEAVLAALPAHRQPLFRASLYLGARPGELIALRARDVDLPTGTVVIRRSHGRNTTKTGSERAVPIHPALVDELRRAVEGKDPDALLFPKPDGSQQRSDTKLTHVLRVAMGRAGVRVASHEYYCRRCFWKTERMLPEPEPLTTCQRCGHRLLRTPKGADVRWYDLRHTNATLHHEHGADPLCVALSLGHAIKNTTQGVYTHVSPARLKRELSRWSLPADASAAGDAPAEHGAAAGSSAGSSAGGSR